MVSSTHIHPESVYRHFRERGAAAWCDFGPRCRVIAALKPIPSGSRPEAERTLRAAWAGTIVGPNVVPIRREDRRAPATLGHGGSVPAAVGWFGYESGAWYERMPTRPAGPRLPLAWWGQVAECAVFDQHDELIGMSEALIERQFEPRRAPSPQTGRRAGGSDKAQYEEGVRRILAHLRAGDCYQVNLTRQILVEHAGDPLDAWLRLRTANPARRAMLIETAEGAVVSNSPELLLRARGRNVVSVPIKGTSALTDGANSLLRSPKERAELTMIVDLVRSDLGRVARSGSVVTGPRRVGRVGHVLHACQRIYASLGDGHDAIDAFAAVFPPGSVTGAPKVRAMEVIAELEPAPRGVYCGAMGWVGRQAMDLNVAIRTMTFHGGVATVPVGAGIVIGSNPEREFAETELKAARMLDALC